MALNQKKEILKSLFMYVLQPLASKLLLNPDQMSVSLISLPMYYGALAGTKVVSSAGRRQETPDVLQHLQMLNTPDFAFSKNINLCLKISTGI